MSAVLAVGDATFDQVVRGAALPVLVDFRADWCQPCRLIEPVLVELADELAGRVLVATVDADENPGLVHDYQVVALPTLQLWHAGDLISVVHGARPKADLRALALTTPS